MTIEEAHQAAIILTKLLSIDIDSIINKFFTDTKERKRPLSSNSERSINEFRLLFKISISKFQSAFSDMETYLALPTANLTIDGSSGELLKNLQVLLDSLIEENLYEAEKNFNWLLSYQLRYGVYYLEKYNISSKEDRNQALQNQLETSSKVLSKQITAAKSLKEELSQSIRKFDDYVKQKHDELDIISSNIKSTNELREQISTTYTEVSMSSAEVKSILSQADFGLTTLNDTLAALTEQKSEVSLTLRELIVKPKIVLRVLKSH